MAILKAITVIRYEVFVHQLDGVIYAQFTPGHSHRGGEDEEKLRHSCRNELARS